MSSPRVTDALGRVVSIDAPANRIVSLVPSETHSVVALSSVSRLVARTDYCELPAEVSSLPSMGGTKDFDVEKIRALKPDLILCNKEENARPRVQALIDAGLPVHVSFPKSVGESLTYLDALCQLLDGDNSLLVSQRKEYDELSQRDSSAAKVFVPIWHAPWMSFNGSAYANDVLALAGFQNVFSDRERRYPLKADIADATAIDAGDRDTRYPRTSLEEIATRNPSVILLPDEPFAFTEEQASILRDILPNARIEFVSGKDLFWYGAYSLDGVKRLASLLDE